MSWKLELLLYAIFFVGVCLGTWRARVRFLKRNYVSKDGYHVTGKVLKELFPVYKKHLDASLYGFFEGILPILLSGPVIIGYVIVAGIGALISVSWLSTVFLGLVILFTLIFLFISRAEIHGETERFSKSVYFEIRNPATGVVQYLSDPGKYLADEQELIETEENLKRASDALEIREIEYQQSIDAGKKSHTWHQTRINNATQSIQHYSNEIILLNKHLQQLLSDDIPRLTADIINQKEQHMKRNHVPHHIQVLQRIASDTTLPESMREDARITLESQLEKETTNEEQARIQDAQIELEIAKKLM